LETSLRRILVAFLAAALAVSTSSCASPARFVEAPVEKVSQALQPFYSQKAVWKDCGTKLKCAFISVPLDWKHPNAKQTIKISAVMHLADNPGASDFLFTNPGGPGASGFDFVHDSLTQVATAKLISSYNIVGFDPRGVDRSEAVTCLNMSDTEKFLYADSGFPYGSPQDFAASKKMIANFVKSCQVQTGTELKHLDTVSAARDLDVLRASVRSPRFNYLGFSYGTLLGNTYATLYPEKVGRMVLDGAEDPTLSPNQKSLNQLKGFDTELRSYLADCLSQKGCPFTGSVSESETKIQKLLLSIETKPLPTKSGRKLTIAAATTGMLLSMYSNTFWSMLTTGFTEAFAGKGDTLLKLADIYNERSPQGDFLTNGLEAFYAISCMDDRANGDLTAMQQQNEVVIATSKVFGRYWQYGALVCSMWPYSVVEHPKSYAAKGSPTVMVVGTTRDPATPYSQAVKLANHILANGFLVTYNGDGHTAYGRGSNCINGTVDDFFLNGTIPAKDPDCN
jgi:pimeloyl-ACP methyl ester carboxylesterase